MTCGGLWQGVISTARRRKRFNRDGFKINKKRGGERGSIRVFTCLRWVLSMERLLFYFDERSLFVHVAVRGYARG